MPFQPRSQQNQLTEYTITEYTKKQFYSINQTFNYTTSNILIKFLKSSFTIVRVSERIKFLNTCKKHFLIPKFLQKNFKHLNFFNSSNDIKFQNLLIKFSMNTLSTIINDSYSLLNYHHQLIKKYKKFIDKNINPQYIFNFLHLNNTHLIALKNVLHVKLKTKINSLLNKNPLHKFSSPPFSPNNTNIHTVINNNFIENNKKKWLDNLTNIPLPIEVEEILQLGPKFNLYNPKQRIPLEKIIINIENSITSLDITSQNNIRSKINNTLTNFTKKNKKSILPPISQLQNSVLIKKFQKTKEFLSQNKNILITNADKTQKTVLITTESYNDKILDLLNDRNTYTLEKKDPTTSIQNRLIKILKSWHTNNYITPSLYKKLLTNNGTPPKFYGLPKLHKPNIPLRPIVATYSSPTYQISKFYSNILSNITSLNNHSIKDSWSFKKFIDSIKIPKENTLFSLDIISLYTNIPIDLALLAVENNWHKINNFTDIPKEEFLNTLKFILHSTYFTYNNKIYSQQFGVPMGSPISSTIAELVLGELETNLLQSLPSISFYKRYVDDIIICANPLHIQLIQKTFNNYHPRLQFTIEFENINKSINFLDLTLIRHPSGAIHTNWHRKNVKTNRYINYYSQTPTKYKRSIITNLVDHAILLSNRQFHYQNIKIIKNILLANNYPLNFITKHINNRIYSLKNKTSTNHNTTPSSNVNNSDPIPRYVSIPYIPFLSHNIEKILNNYNLKTVFNNFNTSNKLLYSTLKDITNPDLKSNLVYSIPCNNCNSVYIGQTKQYLKTRLNQHKLSIKHKLLTPHKPNTALSDHSIDNLHNFNFNNTKILHFEPNLNKRLFLESIEIKKSPTSINYRTDIEKFHNTYDHLFK